MKHVIFDFDGTLVDSLPVVLDIASQMVPTLKITPAEQERLRGLSAREVIKYSGLSYFKLARLMIKGKKIMSQHLDELKVFKGVDEMVRALHAAGLELSVVSSNSEANIRKVLKREGVEKYFTGVYGNVGLFAKSRVFKVVMRDQKAPLSQAIYVGDEVRDIDSAHKAGLPVVSVTWGYNNQAILKKSEPTFLAHSPKELQAILLKAAQA